MAQKNETPVDSTVVTEDKGGTTKPKDKPGASSGQTQLTTRVVTGTLSPELFELVTELRDTVKRIDPRKLAGKGVALLPLSPLRTVRERFHSYGSSLV